MIERTSTQPAPGAAGAGVAGGTHERAARLRAYWRANLKLIALLMAIWFLAGYAHVPFAKALNSVTILTGFPLGYWLASQFSITTFVVLIFVYAVVMNRVIDPKYGFGDPDGDG